MSWEKNYCTRSGKGEARIWNGAIGLSEGRGAFCVKNMDIQLQAYTEFINLLGCLFACKT